MAVALVDREGQIVAEALAPTRDGSDPEEVYRPLADAIAETVAQLPDQPEVLVGIGSAGPISAPDGSISPVNIAAWRDFPIEHRVRQTVEQISKRPVRTVLAGDGHCIALGEHWLGAGRGVDTMVGMVISTGIGAGLIVDGEIFAGQSGNALHVGHTSVNYLGERCVCGGHGCVEMYASGPAMVKYARAHGWRGETGKELARAAQHDDPVALAAVDHGMRALAAGIAQLAADLDVTVFVIGGGISQAGDVVLAPLRRHLADFNVLGFVRHLELRRAMLPNAGLLGAAAAAWRLET